MNISYKQSQLLYS
ncbi:rCG20139 [Rattus norvegicus]|uniref:RCG20139 n=1 Tax=Rattus norvegicus TaxID=10116 RepID=A6JGX3_RAT|nr:rCG20139 [Rattus norvegicus]